MRLFSLLLWGVVGLQVSGCGAQQPDAKPTQEKSSDLASKPVVYQMFTRLYGNQNSTNIPWGTIEQNGVGKFNDINSAALNSISDLGVTHVWYTGVLHHGVIRGYSEIGISNDDPDVVKGLAGSPYAIKDYYNVNPDLAVNPSKRLSEFESLIKRTHEHGLKVIIDIVPNHVARNYTSITKPKGVIDLGANDDKSKTYSRSNDFYYVVGQDFVVPKLSPNEQPLGGEFHPLSDGVFSESPAKWTGNGSRVAQPNKHDWYETVKINYGVRPDGSYDFARLPQSLSTASTAEHYQFWQGKDLPPSWIKMRDIAFYWLDKDVDGFRFDMAEMVPVAFWSYLNSQIKHKNPQATLIAEVYNPSLYRDYIHLGRMDYLYDKVGFYDALKAVMQGKGELDKVFTAHQEVLDIETHMLHFLENHDEQRIASPEFAGSSIVGKPAMVISSLIGTSPTLVYFAQEFGEQGAEVGGFGQPSRTSIFDYVGVPTMIRFNNGGKFDGGQSHPEELSLRRFYQSLLALSQLPAVHSGQYQSIYQFNRDNSVDYPVEVASFVRWSEQQKLLVLANFSHSEKTFNIVLPETVTKEWQVNQSLIFSERLGELSELTFEMQDGQLTAEVTLEALESKVLSWDK
ncbi:alpha-amylase family protein [Shewanella sp. UCD-KL12]|uniref:alpha-amylase family protein n=1 Tax=Shewanella sp. UCD-KL12 TaxID=1917163 RepID=UPI0009FB30BE|nr:alpha-amylase family protein [Shewanella sp. UCD-KL12]